MSKERSIGFTILSMEKEVLVKLEYKKLISNFEFQKQDAKNTRPPLVNQIKRDCAKEKREGFAQGRDSDEGWQCR